MLLTPKDLSRRYVLEEDELKLSYLACISVCVRACLRACVCVSVSVRLYAMHR